MILFMGASTSYACPPCLALVVAFTSTSSVESTIAVVGSAAAVAASNTDKIVKVATGLGLLDAGELAGGGVIRKLAKDQVEEVVGVPSKKSKRTSKHDRDKRKLPLTETEILSKAGIIDPNIGGTPTYVVSKKIKGHKGKITFPIYIPKRFDIFTPKNCRKLKLGKSPSISKNELSAIMDSFPKQYFGSKFRKIKTLDDLKGKAKVLTLHHYHQLGFLNNGHDVGAAYIFLPGILHNVGGKTSSIMHGLGPKGNAEKDLHGNASTIILKDMYGRFCHN